MEETAIPCNGTSVCDNKEDLRLCKNETLWTSLSDVLGREYVQCNGSGQWIKRQKHNDGVFDCVNRRDEFPFKKTQSEKGELVKKNQCTPRSSKSVLVFLCLFIKTLRH